MSAMKFDKTGKLLSVGDKDGRVIIFERIINENGDLDFDYLTEFQSHKRGINTYTNQRLSEAVTQIEWLSNSSASAP